MTKPHIAFLLSDLSAGGAQRVASILCSHWVENGHQVTIITFEDKDQKSFYDLHPDINVIRLAMMGGANNLLKSIPANLLRAFKLHQKLKEIKPDLMISFMPEPNILGLLATRFTNIPILVSERSDPVFIPVQKIWRALRRITYPFATAIICQTPKAASFFTWHNHVVSLPNPILKPPTQTDRTLPELPEKFIAAIGRFSEEKGTDILLHAYTKIAAEIDHDLVLIGKGPDQDKLEKFVAAKMLQKRIHFLGEIENPFSVACQAELYVMPSHFEGFPNALCEAMACGIPAIASHGAAGALPFIEEDVNLVLFETKNANDLSEKIKALLSDRKKALCIAALGQIEVNKLSPDLVCQKWDELIESALAR